MFSTGLAEILHKIDNIDPIKYGNSRNYLDGAVTMLSPYISRGVISTRQVAKSILSKGYKFNEIESLLKELAWRDYFQQVWITKGSLLNTDLKQPQTKVRHFEVPTNIIAAQTGIDAVDKSIKKLYETGYMHNHLRMYVAGITCNVGQSHWLQPARWMYYHLLDADWASNALSWQWVCASFSSKKYYANQENINRYCNTQQKNTFLDIPYESFDNMDIPLELQQTQQISLKTDLPETHQAQFDDNLDIYIYNFYNLDPQWDSHISANRILLLEPDFFKQYPVSTKTIEFILSLSKNIDKIKVVVGNFDEVFNSIQTQKIHYKEHPTNSHYKGEIHERDWMFPMVKGYYPSFFNYWKKCEKYLDNLL